MRRAASPNRLTAPAINTDAISVADTRIVPWSMPGPDLRVRLVAAPAGVDSVKVCYEGHRGFSPEVLHFNRSGKVWAAFAHYAESARRLTRQPLASRSPDRGARRFRGRARPARLHGRVRAGVPVCPAT